MTRRIVELKLIKQKKRKYDLERGVDLKNNDL